MVRVVGGVVCALMLAHPARTAAQDTLRVMTFNIWVGGESGGQSLAQTVAVIRAGRADIVGMQEARGEERDDGTRPDNGVVAAERLGWNHISQPGGRAILGRFEIVGVTPDRQGAEIALPSGRRVFVFNVHLPASPYQPYQLLRIPYGDAPFLGTAEDLVHAAKQARGKEIAAALAEIRPLIEAGRPVLLTGDFNEPSHLDWTPSAESAGVVPLAVPYPTTRAIVALGMQDAYRAVYPGETKHRGLTWTPTTAEDDPKDRHDRIDMIFVSAGTFVESAEIVGESRRYADIVVAPYPSDHRAVVVEVTLPSSSD